MSGNSNGWDGPERAKFGLEIAKLLVGILVAYFVWQLGNTATEARDQRTRVDAQIKAVVDQRLRLWEKVSHGMNEIYCYFLELGDWKDLDGRKILAIKREMDALMYANQIMWDPAFFKTYERFTAATFKTFRGPGLDAALRTTRSGRGERKVPNIDFTNEDQSREVFDAYWAFQKAAKDELHLHTPVPNEDDLRKDVSSR